MSPTDTLKGISAKITFDTETIEIPREITSELENIREIQTKINEIVTEKISELKAENKLVETNEPLEDEEDSDEVEDEE